MQLTFATNANTLADEGGLGHAGSLHRRGHSRCTGLDNLPLLYLDSLVDLCLLRLILVYIVDRIHGLRCVRSKLCPLYLLVLEVDEGTFVVM